MAKKILFVFAGTGRTAEEVQTQYEYKKEFNDDVVRIYFNGCHDGAIGGRNMKWGWISPNLDTVGSKVRASFDKEGNLSIEQLKKEFGSSILIEPLDTKLVTPESFNMMGYSRGAVTTFALARHLNDLKKPIKLFAMDPVPGHSKAEARKEGTEFSKNQDLRSCTNIVHAEVVIGGYKNKVNAIYNKYYRQMAPFFPDTCDSSVYLVPRIDHDQFSSIAANQEINFLVLQKLKRENNIGYYPELLDNLFFIPKVLQQKPHMGLFGRTQYLPNFKNRLFNVLVVDQKMGLVQATGIKEAMTLYALSFTNDFNGKKALIKKVSTDHNKTGKALRDFIVEFENINQFALLDIKDLKIINAMKGFRGKIYEKLNNFPMETATPDQKREFYEQFFVSLKEVKKEIPKQYKVLKTLFADFLRENPIFHTDLTQYLDETETFASKPATFRPPEKAMLTLKSAKTADDMAEILYYFSQNQRAVAIEQFPEDLAKVIKNAEELGKVLRFLPASSIEKVLKIPAMKAYIAKFEDLESILQKCFSDEQRVGVFKALKEHIKNFVYSPAQIGKLLQLFPDAHCLTVFNNVQTKCNPNTPQEFIEFFERLNTAKFKQIVPALEKKLAAFFKNNDKSQLLQGYLHRRGTEGEPLKIYNKLFVAPQNIDAQKKIKSELYIIKEPLGPEPEGFKKSK